MMKSFRNLILSLFLAAGVAGFAACDGTTGPAGVAGPAGAAGATGAKGDTGAAGDSADEIKRDYAYLKTWGIDSGMAACSDPALTGTDDFPGPAALTKPATPFTSTTQTGPKSQDADVTEHDSTPGTCSDKVFGSSNQFMFTQVDGIAANKVESERSGTTSLGNRTLTTVVSNYYGGTVKVTFASGASEIMQRELLFTRCDVGKRPNGDSLMGDYRIEKTLETESLLETVGGQTAPQVDRYPKGHAQEGQPKLSNGQLVPINQAKKYITRICVRFSTPGTVKCYERVSAESRNPSTDDAVTANPKVMERIVLYKNGQFTPVAPMAAPAGIHSVLLGTSSTNDFPFGSTGGTDVTNFNLESVGKLCNLFGEVVNKCGGTTNPNANREGGCA